MNQFTRRKFIFTAGAAAAGSVLVNACSTTTSSTTTESPSGSSSSSAASSPVAAAGGVETTKARLGFIALTDSSPLIIALEKGLFKKYGMTEVEVVKQASWPVTRDNLEVGSEGGGIDGAHILTPIPYLMSMGKTKSKQPLPMYILARLNTNGQAISIAGSYKDAKIALKSANLKEVLAKAKTGGKTDLKAAMTFPGGTHDMWLRYWLAANGVDPNKDLSVIPIPPPQMVANMKAGTMEMFCVGEPWNNQLVNNKIGTIATTTGEIWADHPEKAFAMRGSWVDKNPKAAQALTAAIIEAQQWCDKAENKAEMVKIVSDAKWFKVPPADILGPLQGTVNYGDGRPEVKNFAHAMKFWANNASYPYQSHDLWFLTENIRWGNIPATTDTKAMVKKVNREDIWRAAAKQAGVAEAEIPTSTSRGVETFFDGVKFDPEKPEEYLKSLKIKAA
jgi:nitrate/nitrite transport system substrate-binding protein